MTQEELDSLMHEDVSKLDEEKAASEEAQNDDFDSSAAENYKTSADITWPPPPPSKEHKVVHQLDDVTRDSEEKAIEMMDKLETMNKFFADSESKVKELDMINAKNLSTFTLLNEKFPQVQTFKDILEENKRVSALHKEIKNLLVQGQDEVMIAMDAMQYQDIHRQKIERVINVMRALSRYMNSLFEGKIDDAKRVGSAVHIEGDSTENVVSNDDIDELIASLGKKK